jgi:transcriptional regulator with XRE-family HTH domain
MKQLVLRDHRKAQGISPGVMARRLGVTRGQVLGWERYPERVSAKIIMQYAEALGLQPQDLWREPAIEDVVLDYEHLQACMGRVREAYEIALEHLAARADRELELWVREIERGCNAVLLEYARVRSRRQEMQASERSQSS